MEDTKKGAYTVYVGAMLESHQICFMVVGRDRDQRRCQLLSRRPIPRAPLPSLPGTQHRAKAPGPELRNARNPLTHLLIALHVLTPHPPQRDAKLHLRRPPSRGCGHLAAPRGGSRGGNEQGIVGNLADG